MRWRGRRESDNVEDRRGRSGLPGFGGGGGGPVIMRPAGGCGCLGLLLFGMVFLLLNSGGLFQGASMPGPSLPNDGASLPGPGPGPALPDPGPLPGDRRQDPGAARGGDPTNEDEARQFVRVMLADTEDTWTAVLGEMGHRYQLPGLVLFSGFDRSACGFANGAAGPFYCALDRKVYLDMSFFSELSRRFGASGDFAAAYVIAHEVGHHVQNDLGILPQVNQLRARSGQRQSNDLSVRLELQADCLAGVWGHFAARKGMLEEGDIEEGLRAAAAVGDDTIQRRSGGYVVPESFTHGSAEQRQRWFYRGLQSGDPDSCETFE